jgi:alginate O-acetyltransferase complex protein AlgJ
MKGSKTIGVVVALSLGASVFGGLRFADFKGDLATKVVEANKASASVIVGQDGWLFFVPELRHLSVGTFWGDAAKTVSMATSPTKADPLPAILDFKEQLKKAGIDLLIVPVPAKAAIYSEMIVPGSTNSESKRLDASDAEFIGVLKQKGVNVLDLAPAFIQYRKDHPDQPLYSKEDTHWSGYGIALASDLVAEQVKNEPWYASVAQTKFSSQTAPAKVTGDLVQYMSGAKPGPEDVVLTSVKDAKGGPVSFPRQSPLVLLGDSHNLVYSIGGEMLATSSGFPENLAAKVGFAPDVVGVMGSGATSSRINLARRQDNMAGKKMVVWCFTVREFTEGTGWSKVPVIKVAQ